MDKKLQLVIEGVARWRDEKVEASMKNIRRILLFILSVIGIYVLWHTHCVSRLFLNHKLPAQLSGGPEEIEGQPRPYDYSRMLAIIEQAQNIKQTFYAQFDEQQKKSIDRRYLDLKFIKSVLSDLYRERMRLERHIREIKMRSGNIPPYKKLRTLRYYQKTIEQYSQNIEEILRQW
jgi:hypothetical protein